MPTDNPQLPEIPREVREGDTFGAIDRFKRERASFSCLGMGCGTTLAVLLAIAAIVHFLRR